jgi:membrane-bound lytic murein transglycosylase D
MRTKFCLSLLFCIALSTASAQSPNIIAEQIKKLSPDFQLLDDSATRKYIKEYLVDKQKTANIIQLSYRYLPEIADSLEMNKIPAVLRFLTMGLTNFNLKAVSEDGGSGLWQMKYIPAKNHGVRITSYVDYRRDFRTETSATIKYLKALYKEFGDWNLTVLAYYSDQYEVQKAMRKSESDKFEAIHSQMPAKYKHILPKMTAAAYIFTQADQYSFPAATTKDLPKLTGISIEKWSTLYQISTAIGSTVELLEEANPIFKKGVIPHASYTYDVLIPSNLAEKFYELGDKVYELPTFAEKTGESNPMSQAKVVQPKVTKPKTTASGKRSLYYTVRSGDVVGKIADLYDVRISDVRRWNGLRGDRINIGQKLKIYVPSSRYTYYSKMNRMSGSQKARIRAKD